MRVRGRQRRSSANSRSATYQIGTTNSRQAYVRALEAAAHQECQETLQVVTDLGKRGEAAKRVLLIKMYGISVLMAVQVSVIFQT